MFLVTDFDLVSVFKAEDKLTQECNACLSLRPDSETARYEEVQWMVDRLLFPVFLCAFVSVFWFPVWDFVCISISMSCLGVLELQINSPSLCSLLLADSSPIWICHSDLHPKTIIPAKPSKHRQRWHQARDPRCQCWGHTEWPPPVCQGQVYLAPLLSSSGGMVRGGGEMHWW